MSIIVRLNNLVAVWNSSLHSINQDSQFKLAWQIAALALVIIVIKRDCAKWFCWGLSLVLYLSCMHNFHAAWSHLACIFLSSSASSFQTTFTGLLACYHLSNWAHVGYTMSLFVSQKFETLQPVLSSAIICQIFE